MARGSHKSGVHRRLIRNPDKESNKTMIFDKGEPVYPQSSFTPVPVSKGKLIFLAYILRSMVDRGNLETQY